MIPKPQGRSYAAFDLEIYKSVQNMAYWIAEAPLGISCCAVACEGNPEPQFWSQPRPVMDRHAARALVGELQEIASDFTIVTWNGAGFDFQVLAIESGMNKECAELAKNHVDMMYLVYCIRGHFLGLDKAIAGAGLAGKTHEVTLSTGEKLTGMYGGMAPKLWQQGEYDAVLTYLRGDVTQPLALARIIEKNQRMDFVGLGGTTRMPCSLQTVEEATFFDDRGRWAKNRTQRQAFLKWIYEE